MEGQTAPSADTPANNSTPPSESNFVAPNTPTAPIPATPAPAPIQPEPSLPPVPEPPKEKRKSNLRHIIIIIILTILGLAVAGAIIYFTLHVTGVISTINSNPTEQLTEEEKAARDVATELQALKDRINAFKQDPNSEDSTLESDLQNFLGQMIKDYGKDSKEALNATLALVSYYDFISQYNTAKDYLEDRLSVLDDETNKDDYIYELYRLASKYSDTETANYYLGQINGKIESQSENEQKAKLAYDAAMSIYLAHIMDEYISDESVMRQMFRFAYQAEELNPTGDTAALIAYIENQFGNPNKGAEYLEKAASRDPENYKIGNGEDDVS